MALYKHIKYLTSSNNQSFDQEYSPGSTTPFSAIYKCMGCGHEIVSEVQKPFPPQNHHQHSLQQGKIRWKMIIYADHKSTTS